MHPRWLVLFPCFNINSVSGEWILWTEVSRGSTAARANSRLEIAVAQDRGMITVKKLFFVMHRPHRFFATAPQAHTLGNACALDADAIRNPGGVATAPGADALLAAALDRLLSEQRRLFS
jgi:hypothetical protein